MRLRSGSNVAWISVCYKVEKRKTKNFKEIPRKELSFEKNQLIFNKPMHL